MKFTSVGHKLYGVINRAGFIKILREYHETCPDDDFSWNMNSTIDFDTGDGIDWLGFYLPEICKIIINMVDELRATDTIEIKWDANSTDSKPRIKNILIWR